MRARIAHLIERCGTTVSYAWWFDHVLADDYECYIDEGEYWL